MSSTDILLNLVAERNTRWTKTVSPTFKAHLLRQQIADLERNPDPIYEALCDEMHMRPDLMVQASRERLVVSQPMTDEYEIEHVDQYFTREGMKTGHMSSHDARGYERKPARQGSTAWMAAMHGGPSF